MFLSFFIFPKGVFSEGSRIGVGGTTYVLKEQMQCEVSVVASHKFMEAEANM